MVYNAPSTDVVDWEKFSETLALTITPLPTIESIGSLERAVVDLTSKIQDAMAAASSAVAKKRLSHNGIPKYIRSLIAQRRIARRLWQKSLDPVDKSIYNSLTTRIRDALRQAKNESWKSLLSSLEEDDTNNLWRVSKALRSPKHSSSALHGKNGAVYNAQDKADVIADCLQNQLSPNTANVDHCFVNKVNTFLRPLMRTIDTTPTPFFTPQEVKAIIKQTKKRRSPGPDHIPNKALHALPITAIVAVTNIINGMLRFRHFPQQWKQATIVAIPKPGKDHKFPQNYRPISLLNTLAKVAEKAIYKLLLSFTRSAKIIPNEQFGFRAGHSTSHQLLRVVEYIVGGFNYGKHTGAVFLDVSKAFDKVWHNGLLYKLIKMGCPLYVVHIIASYLKLRTFRVRFNGAMSATQVATAGVFQGSIISPLLYNIFVSDLPLPPENGIIAQYADDTAILFRSFSTRLVNQRLQNHLDGIEAWCKKWRVAINADKSAAILFSRRNVKPFDILNLDRRPIPWRDKATYLGLILDRKVHFKEHLSHVVQKAKASMARLYPLIGAQSDLSLKNKLRLFKTIIRPQLTYACPVWTPSLKKSSFRKLEVIQSKSLRICSKAPYYVRNDRILKDLDISHLSLFVKNTSLKFFEQSAAHLNPEVKQAVNYNVAWPWKVRRPKQMLSF